MPPPLKPPAALPDKLPLSKALLERRPSVTIVTDWRGTPVASLGNSVTVPKFEDDSSQKHTDDTEEPLVDVMDEPHESIEIEIATVFKDQLDLYRAEHQELTKVRAILSYPVNCFAHDFAETIESGDPAASSSSASYEDQQHALFISRPERRSYCHEQEVDNRCTSATTFGAQEQFLDIIHE